MNTFEKLMLAVACVAMLGGLAPAHADQPAAAAPSSEVFRIDVPASWAELPGQAERIAQSFDNKEHFSGTASELQIQTWRSGQNGAALVVSWLKSRAPVAAPAEAARMQLEAIRAQPERAAFEPGDTELLAWREDVQAGVAEGRLEWRHLRNGTVTLVRTVVFQSTAGLMHQVTAECILGPGGDGDRGAELRATCDHMLGSLAVVLPESERAPLAPAPAPATAEAGAPPAGAGPAVAEPQTTIREIGDGEHKGGILLVRDSGPDRSQNRQKWLYGLGGLLLVLAFYLTTRRRNEPSSADDDLPETDAHPAAAAEHEDGEHDPDGDGERDQDGERDPDGDGERDDQEDDHEDKDKERP